MQPNIDSNNLKKFQFIQYSLDLPFIFLQLHLSTPDKTCQDQVELIFVIIQSSVVNNKLLQ